MSGNDTNNDTCENRRYDDEAATCMSSLLPNGREKVDNSAHDIEMAIAKKKFPVLDSQVVFTAVPKEKANIV